MLRAPDMPCGASCDPVGMARLCDGLGGLSGRPWDFRPTLWHITNGPKAGAALRQYEFGMGQPTDLEHFANHRMVGGNMQDGYPLSIEGG